MTASTVICGMSEKILINNENEQNLPLNNNYYRDDNENSTINKCYQCCSPMFFQRKRNLKRLWKGIVLLFYLLHLWKNTKVSIWSESGICIRIHAIYAWIRSNGHFHPHIHRTKTKFKFKNQNRNQTENVVIFSALFSSSHINSTESESRTIGTTSTPSVTIVCCIDQKAERATNRNIVSSDTMRYNAIYGKKSNIRRSNDQLCSSSKIINRRSRSKFNCMPFVAMARFKLYNRTKADSIVSKRNRSCICLLQSNTLVSDMSNRYFYFIFFSFNYIFFSLPLI